MNGLIMAGQMVLGLSLLIILHELGHFLAARAFGIKVEKFFLFFDAWGVKLFSVTYKGCEYGIGWLPLGGYVKIAGMIDESMDTEQLAGPPQPWEFRSKPAWQRLIVMLGGVTVNLVLGVFIFWMLIFKYGETYMPAAGLKNGISPGIVGKAVGLKAGDKILAINGKPIVRFEELMSSKVLLGNSVITVDRSGKSEDITVPGNILEMISDHGREEFAQPRFTTAVDSVIKGYPAEKVGIRKGDKVVSLNGRPIGFYDELRDSLGHYKNTTVTLGILRAADTLTVKPTVNPLGQIGYFPVFDEIKIAKADYNLFTALPVGAAKAWGSLADNAKGLGKVVTGKLKAQKAFSSPIEIARKFYGGTFTASNFWSITGLLSMALALMNLLPIPVLDGGHAIFLLVEMVKGKPVSDKFMERAQIAGFCILIALMVFIVGNDILKIVVSK